MNQNDNSHRHLLIRSPILNEKSCYTSSCHAHQESDEVLGSLVIKIPLEDLDTAVEKSSSRVFPAGNIYNPAPCLVFNIIHQEKN